MKKKIGIITLFGYHNYGNRLQNYAVQHILEKLGFEVESIKNKTAAPVKKLSKLQRIYKNKNNLVKKITEKLSNVKYKKLNERRIIRFEEFTKKNIKETPFCISNNNIPKTLDEEYDFFITGSDQVWNPFQRGTEIEFLMFASQKKRISFSASIGTSFIPEERKEFYTKALNQMASISVRENEAQEIVENLTQRTDIEILLDPTMLLSKEEWINITTKHAVKPYKYILVYFLGEKTKEYKNFIDKTSRDNNFKIIELLNPKYEEDFLTDPAEFVELINNASLICTDSFHGAAFSILLNKYFLIFNRSEDSQASMNSRLNTLLKKFKLENRYWSNNYDKKKIFENIDYKKINELLETEKIKAHEFLKKSLAI